MKVAEFLQADTARVEALIEAHPNDLSVNDVAEFLKLDPRSVRSVLENGLIGLCWKKEHSLNRGFYISTAMFVRWYMLQQGFNICS